MVVIVAVGALAWFVGRDGGTEAEPAASPEEAVQGLYRSIADGDGSLCDRLGRRAQDQMRSVTEATSCRRSVEETSEGLTDAQREGLRHVEVDLVIQVSEDRREVPDSSVRIGGTAASRSDTDPSPIVVERRADGWIVVDLG